MKITPPPTTEDNGFFNLYIHQVKYTDLIQGLTETHALTKSLINSLSDQQLAYSYEANKWTIKQILGHLMDAERTFAYRALRFARTDKTVIPGWDINLFMAASEVQQRNINDLMEEFGFVRNSTIALFKSFNEKMLNEKGPARDIQMSVRAIGYTILGHEIHHLEVIRERYLVHFKETTTSL